MADNVDITAGTGTTVKTDQLAGGEHVQYMKLLDGTADSEAVIKGDATNGLDVDVTRLPTLASVTTVDAVTSITNPVSLTTDNEIAINNTVTVGGTVGVSSIAAGDNNIGNVDIVTMPNVTIGAAIPAGANAIGKLAANSGVDIGDVDVTSIAAGTNNIGSFIPYAQPAAFVSGATASITDTTQTTVIAAQGAGVVIYMTSLQVMNADSETGTWVKITDGAGGTTKWTGYADYAGGGFAKVFPTPIVFTANTAVVAECETSGATVRVCVGGYKV